MDIAVVGAGPAGATAAAELARLGHRVTLYDPSHPREKPCGGGVPAGALRRHPELAGLAPLGRAVTRVRLWTPRRRCLELEIPEPIVVFSRARLDAALLERALAAGARLREQRVVAVAMQNERLRLRTADGEEQDHEFVVGADGAASVVRRSLLPRPERGRRLWVTAGFHVQGLAEPELAVEFLPDLPGYLWAFPRRDHASVGIMAPARRLGGAVLRARVLDFLERRYPHARSLACRRYGAAIPAPTWWGGLRPRLGGPRFALVGDAAAQVDAITGEGIEHGMAAAKTLAAVLAKAPPERAWVDYTSAWMRGPGRELAVAARWAARWYRPALVELCLGIARRSQRTRAIVRELLMVMQPYTSLRSRTLRDALHPPERRRAPARPAGEPEGEPR